MPSAEEQAPLRGRSFAWRPSVRAPGLRFWKLLCLEIPVRASVLRERSLARPGRGQSRAALEGGLGGQTGQGLGWRENRTGRNGWSCKLGKIADSRRAGGGSGWLSEAKKGKGGRHQERRHNRGLSWAPQGQTPWAQAQVSEQGQSEKEGQEGDPHPRRLEEGWLGWLRPRAGAAGSPGPAPQACTRGRTPWYRVGRRGLGERSRWSGSREPLRSAAARLLAAPQGGDPAAGSGATSKHRKGQGQVTRGHRPAPTAACTPAPLEGWGP